jgi:orotidine-5'-phosphate decarboxylase
MATPAEALCNDASSLVAGRPIIHATDPAEAAEAILKEISTGL